MIKRDPSRAATDRYDVVIIGGGVLGVCHLFEAVCRGLRALLLERDDFGGATSWSSQRIVHGGLRYLQSLNFSRHHTSVRERTWLLRHFPDQVRPLPCVMPLYDRGLKRRMTLGAALRLNDWLSRRRNDGLDASQRLSDGRLLSPDETAGWFDDVERAGLRGGALWYDGVMLSPQRLLMEWLRWSCHAGATALNYVEVTGLQTRGRTVTAVEAIDRCEGSEHAFETSHVINTAGPWMNSLAERLTGSSPNVPLCLAFCVLLDRPALSEAAVAVSPGQCGHPTYFLTPCHGRILAGTAHLPWNRSMHAHCSASAGPTEAQVRSFLDDLNASVPRLNARDDDVLRIFSGLLPAVRPGAATPSGRTQWIDHAKLGGPTNMISVTGIKYTTARMVAERTCRMRWPDRSASLPARPTPREGLNWLDAKTLSDPLTGAEQQMIQRLADEEAVMHPDDLLHRRTDWGAVPGSANRVWQLLHEVSAAAGTGRRESLECRNPA